MGDGVLKERRIVGPQLNGQDDTIGKLVMREVIKYLVAAIIPLLFFGFIHISDQRFYTKDEADKSHEQMRREDAIRHEAIRESLERIEGRLNDQK